MIKTNQTSAPEFPGQRVRVAEREQDRSWLLVNRRVYCQKHGVPAVAARAAMPEPEQKYVLDGRTVITDAVYDQQKLRRQAYVRDLSERRERAYDYLDACVDRVVAASAIVDKRIGNGDVWGVHRAQVAEHMRVREYLRAEAAVENLPAVPRSPAALRPVDPETLRVPFPASRVYPALATCTSPRRRGILSHRAARADEVAASRFLKRYPSASEFAVFDAEARSFARLQRMLAAQAEAQTVSTGQAVITT